MTVGGVDQHQRAEDKEKRVFILTRSFFAGQQRYGANTWSGDVGSSWDSFRKQVPLCLNHTLTANPNVNTDIGGFFASSYNTQGANSATRNPQFQELYVRWMQFGLFCPMMRSHGTDAYRELYYYGNPGDSIYDALVNTVKMRYRLLPYIYSLSWQVSRHDDSFMRALVMDFKDDPETWDNGKEFMFGHSLLVCPVTDPLYTQEKIIKTDAMTGWDSRQSEGETSSSAVDWSAKKRYTVYLPKGADWYDFWTDEKYTGGQELSADAPIAHSPLYVKAGSILPVGQDLQYSNEKSWDNITLQVYPGADASFTLYEDEGDGYGYQQGAYTEIPIAWNEKSHTLTIGKRKGTYPGMLATRTFQVRIPGAAPVSVTYSGKEKKVKI
jgi:alpha-D-xyloside xylohydrolase